MGPLNLEIISPSRKVFTGEIQSITVPGTLGSFQVLKNHAPIISTIEIGLIKVKISDNSIKYYATGGGVVEVLDNKVSVLADSVEAIEEIDVERAKAAKGRAEERLSHPTNTTNLERARLALNRAVNRLALVEKYIRAEV